MNYDAIVIGTGFGATVAATRLVAKGKRVLILERGTWWVTPENPEQSPAVKDLYRWIKQNRHPVQYFLRPENRDGLMGFYSAIRSRRNKGGLYNFSKFKQAYVLTASGVGGGSLIYSNVNSLPRPEVIKSVGLNLGEAEFQAARDWMQTYRGRLNQIVTKVPLPGRDISDLGADSYLYVDRSRALKEAASAVSEKLGIDALWQALDLSITEYDPERAEESQSFRDQTFCQRQSRCILGCLPAATHALSRTLYNRLLAGSDAGATLWPLANVRYVKAIEGGYEVSFEDYGDDGKWKTVSAPMVFFGGGVLGTSEILLRSRERETLALSDKLGTHFSTNGNFSGFVVGTRMPVHTTTGPTNSSAIRVKFDGYNITVEDCGIPDMFAPLVTRFLRVAADSNMRRTFRGKLMLSWGASSLPELKKLRPSLNGDGRNEDEMMANTFYFNVSSEDDASGVLRLHKNGLDLDWPTPISNHPVFEKIETLLRHLSEAMGGRYAPFPLWRGFADRKLMILHPLGGCPIGPTNSEGVIDEFGRVFDASKAKGSTDVYSGLYVVDGSALPGAVATNPVLTIAAQAIKAVKAALP